MVSTTGCVILHCLRKVASANGNCRNGLTSRRQFLTESSTQRGGAWPGKCRNRGLDTRIMVTGIRKRRQLLAAENFCAVKVYRYSSASMSTLIRLSRSGRGEVKAEEFYVTFRFARSHRLCEHVFLPA